MHIQNSHYNPFQSEIHPFVLLFSLFLLSSFFLLPCFIVLNFPLRGKPFFFSIFILWRRFSRDDQLMRGGRCIESSANILHGRVNNWLFFNYKYLQLIIQRTQTSSLSPADMQPYSPMLHWLRAAYACIPAGFRMHAKLYNWNNFVFIDL